MKKTDKFLIGIVIGIVLLIAVAFAVALKKPDATYKAEDTPEGIAFNYLFALQQREYERAYGYLSPKIIGYPKNAEAFADDVREYSWNFRDLESGSFSLEIVSKILMASIALIGNPARHVHFNTPERPPCRNEQRLQIWGSKGTVSHFIHRDRNKL